MKKGAILVLIAMLAVVMPTGLALAGPSCTPEPGPSTPADTRTCFPTPAECATGDYNGVYQVGPAGRGSICVGGDGQIVVYTGGNANALCGTIIVADQVITGSYDEDPNTCPM